MKMYSVGQKLWFVGSKINPRQYEIEVTKVGRLWATLGDDGRYRCDASGQVDGGHYASPGRCYVSREAYELEQARSAAWLKFKRMVADLPEMPCWMTLDALAQMSASFGDNKASQHD
jgi:hypothetical protein